jgi:hypothetical protein
MVVEESPQIPKKAALIDLLRENVSFQYFRLASLSFFPWYIGIVHICVMYVREAHFSASLIGSFVTIAHYYLSKKTIAHYCQRDINE